MKGGEKPFGDPPLACCLDDGAPIGLPGDLFWTSFSSRPLHTFCFSISHGAVLAYELYNSSNGIKPPSSLFIPKATPVYIVVRMDCYEDNVQKTQTNKSLIWPCWVQMIFFFFWCEVERIHGCGNHGYGESLSLLQIPLECLNCISQTVTFWQCQDGHPGSWGLAGLHVHWVFTEDQPRC